MEIDSSALLAILRVEPEGRRVHLAIRTAFPLVIAAPTAIEASIVILSRFGEQGLSDLERLLEEARIEVAPVISEHVRIAVDVFRRFGGGRHRVALDFR